MSRAPRARAPTLCLTSVEIDALPYDGAGGNRTDINVSGVAQADTLPPADWAAHGLTPADVAAVLAALHVSAPGSPLDPEGAQHGGPGEHFAAVLAELGLNHA